MELVKELLLEELLSEAVEELVSSLLACEIRLELKLDWLDAARLDLAEPPPEPPPLQPVRTKPKINRQDKAKHLWININKRNYSPWSQIIFLETFI